MGKKGLTMLKMRPAMELLGVTKAPLYLLPGQTRSQDRIVPAQLLDVKLYRPSKDLNLHTDTRLYARDVLKVTVAQEPMHMYDFVVACRFDVCWTSVSDVLAAFGYVLFPPIFKAGDNAFLCSQSECFALHNGCVYCIRQIPGGCCLVELLSVKFDFLKYRQAVKVSVDAGLVDLQELSPH